MRTSLSAQCRRQKSSKRGREGTETACIPVYRGTTDAAEFKLRREDDCDLDVADEELQRNVIQFTTRSCAAMNVGSYLRTNVMKRSGNGSGVGGAATHSVHLDDDDGICLECLNIKYRVRGRELSRSLYNTGIRYRVLCACIYIRYSTLAISHIYSLLISSKLNISALLILSDLTL